MKEEKPPALFFHPSSLIPHPFWSLVATVRGGYAEATSFVVTPARFSALE
jgi:hypothetical protein